MKPFTQVTSPVIPLCAANIDTDQIIPAQFVNVQGTPALADALFANLRRNDPQFILNQPGMLGRQIVLSGRNFGCGSSREAAAWALGAAGVRALVGVSFNTTFWTNCINNAILPVTVSQAAYDTLCDAYSADPGMNVTVDLVARSVSADAGGGLPGQRLVRFEFETEAFARDLLISGQDELGYLLQRQAVIRQFVQRRTDNASPQEAAR